MLRGLRCGLSGLLVVTAGGCPQHYRGEAE
jgi:hypothetical protein